jgi:phage-related protein
MEIAAAHHRGAFRAVYVVNLGDAVCVLHAFEKKSKRGIRTSKADIELIRERLRRARELAGEKEG